MAEIRRPAGKGSVSLCYHFANLPADEPVSLVYGEVFRYLKQKGHLIGANDLWIDCTATAREVPYIVDAN